MKVNLLKQAKTASQNAYAPYSKFHVGASILFNDGSVYSGCNVENASYGLTICAERNAIFQGVVYGKKKIKKVVIYTPTKKPTMPCGACRQVIWEFGKDVEIESYCDGKKVEKNTIRELLPKGFDL